MLKQLQLDALRLEVHILGLLLFFIPISLLTSDLGSNRTVLLSTHIVEDIAQTCQRVAVMKNGSVIYQGTIRQLLQQTQLPGIDGLKIC